MVSEGKIVRTVALLITAFTYLFLYVPIIVLLIFSFNSERFPSPWTKFSLKWYQELFHSEDLWHSFSNSLIVASFATLISLISGVCLIFYASQGGRVKRYLGMFYGNLLIPETVLAVCLLTLFATLKIPLGLNSLILAHTVLGLGFVVPITYARYRELDPNLTEASLDLGATPIQTFFKVTLPMLRPTLITTSLLVFIISFDDFILSYFVAGSSAQTLSLYILSMIRSGVSPVVNALSSILFFFSSLLAFTYFSIHKRVRIIA